MMFFTGDAEQETVKAWKSSSLYIGDLLPEVTEQLLNDIFQIYGPLDSVKVCKNWETGQPLGYGFINFQSDEHAEEALNSFNYQPILGQPCRLMWSTKRNQASVKEDSAANVFVKGLAKTVDDLLLFNIFSEFGHILSTRVAKNKNGSSLGYGYVSFAGEAAALAAIKHCNDMKLHGSVISVERFLSREARMEKPWSNVHVLGIPSNWTTDMLTARFEVYGPIRSAVVMSNTTGCSRGFGFVDFIDHISAVQACDESMNFPQNIVQFLTAEQLNSDIFKARLRVTPALKKVDRKTDRIPRAGVTNKSISSPKMQQPGWETSPIGSYAQVPRNRSFGSDYTTFHARPLSVESDFHLQVPKDFRLNNALFSPIDISSNHSRTLSGPSLNDFEFTRTDTTALRSPSMPAQLIQKPFGLHRYATDSSQNSDKKHLARLADPFDIW